MAPIGTFTNDLVHTSPLASWESFYVIVGSSAGALTGLQFVVMALIADTQRRPSAMQIGAFSTPNILHFCAVLLLSAVLSAPWSGLAGVALSVGAVGVAGIAYVGVVFSRTRRQQVYTPVFEDWLWHVALPLASYVLLLIAAFTLARHSSVALFMIGATSLILMFAGIHNAWDTVTFIVTDPSRLKTETPSGQPGENEIRPD
jgi:hypothetical protein